MIDTLKPGQSVNCTILKAPRTEDRQQTILRLMRRVPVMEEDHELDKGPHRAAGITPGPAQEEPIREGHSSGN